MNGWALTADVGVTNWSSLGAGVVLALLPAAFSAPLLYAVFNRVGRSGYSRRAVQSVGLFILAMAATLGAGILVTFGHYTTENSTPYRILAAVVGAASWSTAVVGVMYALRGLKETEKKGRRRRGRKYAVGGCTGNVLTLLALAIGGGWSARTAALGSASATAGTGVEAAAIFAEATRVATEALKNAPAYATGPALPGPISPKDGDETPPATLLGFGPPLGSAPTWFGTVFGTSVGDTTRDRGPPTLDYPGLNVRLRQPPEGWMRLDPARAGSQALVAYDLPPRKLRFLVAAERPGVESGATLEGAIAAAQARLRSVVPALAFGAAESRTIAGVAGQAVAGAGQLGAELCSAALWIGMHNGFVYELLVVGSGESAEVTAAAARPLFDLFEPFDPSAVARSGVVGLSTTAFQSTDLGIEIKPLAGWTAWSDVALAHPLAEYGARYDARTGLVVAAAPLRATGLDRAAATFALLSLVDQPYVAAVAGRQSKVTQSELAGEQYDWKAVGAEGGFRTARIFVGRNVGYVLLGWYDAEGSPRHEALKAAMDAVKFDASTAASSADASTGRKLRSGRFYEAAGSYLLSTDQAEAAEQVFRAAFALLPNDPGVAAKVVDACFARQRYSEALKLLQDRKDLTSKHESLRVREAEASAAIGKRAEAFGAYATLFRGGYLDDAAMRRFVELAEQTSRWGEALTVVSAYRGRRNTPAMLAIEARLLSERGDYFAAVQMLERHLSKSPSDVEPAIALADVYRRMQRPAEAMQVIDKLIAGGGRSSAAYYWKGLSEYDLRQTRSARDSFEQAHRLNPTDVPAKQMLDHVTRLLGEAENLRIRTPIAAVPLPASVVSAVPTTPQSDEANRAAAYYLDRVTAYSFKPGEDFRRTEYHTVRVLTEEGVNALNTFSLRFDPLSEEVFVNRLDVYDDAGRPIATGDVAAYYLIDDQSTPSSARERLLEMPVPGLRPGYRVELVATVRSYLQRTKFPFVTTTFGLPYPARRQAVVVATNAADLAWSGSLADDVRRDPAGVWWQATDLPGRRREPFSPDAADVQPTLYVADKRSTWDAEVRQYVEGLAEVRIVPTTVENKARELTAGIEGVENKMLAVAAFVQREIAHRPGSGGLRSLPQSADKTLADRFGNSADASLLLAQMLATVRVDARLALANTSEPVQEKLPTIEQFDRVVVYIPQGDSGRVIDATDKEADARLPVPLRLAGRRALVIDDEKTGLVQLPKLTDRDYRAEVARQVEFTSDGTARVTESVTFRDYYAATMRGRLRNVPAAERSTFWQKMLREAGTPVVVRSFRIERFDDLTEPLVVAVEYDVERALTAVGDDASRSWVGALPAAFEATLLTAPPSDERRQPISFPFTLNVTSVIDVKAPTDTALPTAESLAGNVESQFLTVRRTAAGNQAQLRITLEMNRPAGRHEAEQYEEYRAALRRARDAASPIVRFPASQPAP